MKFTKYIMSLILFLLINIFIVESYPWYLNSFSTEYTAMSLYLQKDQTQEEMIKDIKIYAKKNNIEIFTVQNRIENLHSTKINIYGTSNVKKILDEKSQVKTGVYTSIFLGKSEVNIQSLKHIPDIKKTNYFNVYGEKKDILAFRRDTINKYAGKFPTDGYVSMHDKRNILFLEIIAFSLILFLTLYEVAIQKKEIAIKILNGESLKGIIILNIIKDCVFFIVSFTSLSIFFITYYNIIFNINITLITFILFLVLNTLIFLSLLKINVKNSLTSRKGQRRILQVTYIYKVVILVLSLFLISSSTLLIYKAFKFSQQKDFFESHKDYSYINIFLNNNSYDKNTDMYFQLNKELNRLNHVVNVTNLKNFNDKNEVPFIYIKNLDISSIKRNINLKENKIYFLLPQKSSNNDKKMIKSLWESYFPYDYKYEYISYDNKIKLTTVYKVDDIVSERVENGNLIINNLDDKHQKKMTNDYIYNSSMYKINNNQFENFKIKHRLTKDQISKTNVYNDYLYKWIVFKKSAIIGIVLSLLILILELLTTLFLIKYEFRVNSYQITLKKILGYSFLQRYKNIFLINTISTVLSIITIILINNIFYNMNLIVLLSPVIFIYYFEQLSIYTYIKKLEKQSIQKILKGKTV